MYYVKYYVGKDIIVVVGFSNFLLVIFVRVSFSNMWGFKVRLLLD